MLRSFRTRTFPANMQAPSAVSASIAPAELCPNLLSQFPKTRFFSVVVTVVIHGKPKLYALFA